jgi:hypothetical protein
MNASNHPVASLFRNLPRVARAAFALVVMSSPVGCIIVDNSTPAPVYSPEDLEVTPPTSPAINAHFDQVFHNVACTPSAPGGIDTWTIAIDGTSQSSGTVNCDDPSGLPFIAAFENLRSDTDYSLTATGYTYDGRACYIADCTAHTMVGAHAVLPACTVTKVC